MAFRSIPVVGVTTLASVDKVVELLRGLAPAQSGLSFSLGEYAILQAVEGALRDHAAHKGLCCGWIGRSGTLYTVGDRVQHYGTRAWGVVQGIIPQRDGSIEMEVLREARPGEEPSLTWWASYHIGLDRPVQAPER